MPAHQQWQHYCNKGNNASLTTAKTLALDDSNKPIVTRAAMPAQWLRQLNYGRDAIAMRATIATAMTAQMPVLQWQQFHCNEGNNATVMMARMPVHWWWQQCHCNKGNDASLRWQQRHCNKGNKAIADQGKQCHCYKDKACWQQQGRLLINNGDDTIVMRTAIAIATQYHCNKGNSTITMMERIPEHQSWQQRHCNKGNDAILRTTTMPLQWGQQCCCRSRAMMPLLGGQWRKPDNGKDACTSKMATMPSSWGQQLQCNNGEDACVLTATTPSQQGQQCHCNDSKDACASIMTTMAFQWRQQCQLEGGTNAIATRATMLSWIKKTMPLLQGEWHQLDNSKDACALIMATTPLSWGQQLQLQQWQKCLCIDSNNTITTMATMPAWQQAMRATILAQQQNSRDACTSTMATTPSWQEQQLPLQQWQRGLRIDDNNAIIKRATKPSQWGQQHQLDNKQQVYTILWHHAGISAIAFVPTFPTGKGRSGWRQLDWFQHDAKQLCMPLDWLGGGGLTSRRGKSHICNFGLATNLSLFFFDILYFVLCPPKNIFFSGVKWVSRSKTSSIHPLAQVCIFHLAYTNMCGTLISQNACMCVFWLILLVCILKKSKTSRVYIKKKGQMWHAIIEKLAWLTLTGSSER
jgi:hypothetical protein